MHDTGTIDVRGLNKRFRLRSKGTRTLKSAAVDLLKGRRRKTSELWALQDITFQVRRGETLGIIGANGAGKSTFLSLVAGSMTPTSGTVETAGSVSALLELGAGFHPDLTGRENVFLNGAIMGLSRRNMENRFNAIVEFAGLHDFIDEPVKHYSSGMYVRLGFAVAVEVNPDILLIDEVLAVGDVAFQRKCIDCIDDFRRRRKTMLIVSHDLGTIQSISDRILFLEGGRIKGIGDPDSMVGQYRTASREKATAGLSREWGTGEAKIESVTLKNRHGSPARTFAWGEPLRVALRIAARERVASPVVGFSIADTKGRLVYGNNTQIEKVTLPDIADTLDISLDIERLIMAGGDYLLSFSLHSPDHRTNYHRLDHAFPFTVDADRPFEGTYMPCTWKVDR